MTSRDLFRLGEFRKLFFGQTISALGDGMTNIGLILLVNAIGGLTSAVALLGILLAVPQVTIGLLSGVFVDRWDKRRVMIVSDALRALLVLALVPAIQWGVLWPIYALAFAQAAVGTFFNPARTALMPAAIPSEGLMAANSIIGSAGMIAGTLGFGVASLLIALTGSRAWPFVIDALTFLISVICVIAMRTRVTPAPAASQPDATTRGDSPVRKVWRELRAGLLLVRDTPVLLSSTIVLSVMMLGLGAVNVLFPAYIVRVLHIEESWIGAVVVMQVAGAVVSGLATTWISRHTPYKVMTVALVVIGVAVLAVGALPALGTMLVAMFGVGLVNGPFNAAAGTLTQRHASADIIGRAAAAQGTAITTASLVSMALSGMLGDVLGITGVFLAAGVVTLLAALYTKVLLGGRRLNPA